LNAGGKEEGLAMTKVMVGINASFKARREVSAAALGKKKESGGSH